MIYFYNKEDNVLFCIEDFSKDEIADLKSDGSEPVKSKFEIYIESMSKDGYELISKKEYDKITDSNLKMVSAASQEHNDKFIAEKKQAIADAKKAGWSDTMIEQTFGKVE